jgi:nucleotide-binding universal stress UspA family protein
MVKRILVPTDGSAYSRRALSTALEYAKVFNAEIKLFHVVSQPPTHMYDFTIKEYYPLSEEQVAEIGANVFDSSLKELETDSIKITKKVVTGYPAAEIIHEISEDVDLVIIGTRGHRPLAGALIGSVTQRVLAEANCPVMAIK